MLPTENYEVLILGSGEAGKYLAWTLAGSGKRTALVERMYVGGSCPNIACLPSKNVVHSATVASYFRRSQEFGIQAQNWSVDMVGVRARKRRMVDDLIAVHLDRFKSSGAELVLGEGKFIAPRTLQVTLRDGSTQVLYGDRVVISTGSRAIIQQIPGLADTKPMTHIGALELGVLPGHFIVLGGGYVGLEFAQGLRRFGSKVTVIEKNDRLLSSEDEDISEALLRLFEDEGIDVRLRSRIFRVEGISGERVTVHCENGGSPIQFEGTHLLAAIGRTPNTDGIGLEVAGVSLDERGFIKVDENLRTTSENVWAVGDCAGSPQFTHRAYDDFRIVRDNLAGGNRSSKGRQIPSCLFTDPEFARIGLSETEARREGIEYRLAKIPAAAVLRTRTLSETRGFLKCLVEAASDRILGFSAFCVDSAGVMGVVQLAMMAGVPYTSLRDAIFTHPTMVEGLNVLFSKPPSKVQIG